MTEISWTEEKRTLSELKPFEHNPRRINKAQFEKLLKSLTECGYHQRLVINADNTVIGGHQRIKALKQLGFKEIDVLVPNRQLTEREFKQVNITDNLNFGEFDMDILANAFEIEDLIDWGMPEDLLPTLDSIDSITEDDDKVDTNVDTHCKLGDVWILGNHRLMCGDSTSPENTDKLMNGAKPDLIYADPPYGIDVEVNNSYQSGNGNGLVKKNIYGKILNDSSLDTAKDCYNFLVAAYTCSLVYWGANYYDFLPISKCWLSWYKKDELPADTFCDTELAFTNTNKHSKTFPVQWKGMIKEGEMGERRIHPTQKPVKLAIDVFNYLDAGNIIYDPFGGSGTTLIAAEKSNRKCLMMELSPHFCDIIINRWEKQTNQKAIIEGESL